MDSTPPQGAPDPSPLSRRRFLRNTVITGLVASTGGLLAACADSGGDAASTASPSASASASASAGKAGKIVMGTSDAMTGDFASVGTWQNRGAILAVADYKPRNFDGVDLVTLDNRGDPTEAVSVFNKFVDQHKVPVIQGGFSNLSKAVAPVAARTKTVYLNCQAPLDDLRGLPYVYNTQPLTSQEMELMAAWYMEQGFETMAAIYSTEFDGASASKALSDAFTKLGGKVVASESHEGGAVDFATQVAKVRAAEPAVIHVHSPFNDAARIIKQLRDNGVTTQVTSYRGFESPSVFEVGGEALEGMVFTQTLFDTSDPKVKDVADRYEAQYGEAMNNFVAVKYDATWATLEAIDLLLESGEELTGEALNSAMVGTRFATPLSGPTELTSDGVVKDKPMALKTVKDGAFTMLEVFSG